MSGGRSCEQYLPQMRKLTLPPLDARSERVASKSSIWLNRAHAEFAFRARGTSASMLVLLIAGGMAGWRAFAPMGEWPVLFVAIALLSAIVFKATRPLQAALFGLSFGWGYFAMGLGWLAASLHDFAALPETLAYLAVAIFCGYHSLFLSLACWLAASLRTQSHIPFSATFAASWTILEIARSYIAGLEWQSAGYSQAPSGLAIGLAPLFGVFGVGFALVLFASMSPALCTWIVGRGASRRLSRHIAKLALVSLMVVGILVGASLLRVFSFTDPIGEPLTVSLIQPGVLPDIEMTPESYVDALVRNETLLGQTKGSLVLLPESSFQVPLERLPQDYADGIDGWLRRNQRMLIAGMPINESGALYNGAQTLGAGSRQQYRKVHLVPFGEYKPLTWALSWLYVRANFRIEGFSPGLKDQPPITLASQTLGISICFEDAFSRDVARSLPEATILVNLGNAAWLGESGALNGHLQMAQMRAVEFERPLLRVNTIGVTALIDRHGRVVERLVPLQRGILEVELRGRTGLTPFARYGQWPIMALCASILGMIGATNFRLALIKPRLKSRASQLATPPPETRTKTVRRTDHRLEAKNCDDPHRSSRLE